MTKNKYTALVCGALTVAMLAISVLFLFGEQLGITSVETQLPYVSSLFSTDEVHTLDIIVDEDSWQAMLDNATAEEYIMCNIVLDGTVVQNVGIRPKGNSSLSQVAASDSDRYSFKLEFDHYDSGQTYLGLDKLALNNIVQDATYLKDYLVYQMMGAFGADSPLCSYIDITVNGESWGLYLCVEAVEESFAQRNYGNKYGEIYKPETMSMNMGEGGRGNGGMAQIEVGDFNPEDFDFGNFNPEDFGFENFDGENMPQDMQGMFGNGQNTQRPNRGENGAPQNGQEQGEINFDMPDDGEEGAGAPPPDENGMGAGVFDEAQVGGFGGIEGGVNIAKGGFGGNSGTLAYIDDDPESYAYIFDYAVFKPSADDKTALINALKILSEGGDVQSALNVEEVLRYFVVHNFVLNFDSYTGSMLHNYYLYEEDGLLSMIAWDYNLAFGSFAMGASSDATALANYPIDTPTTGISMESRPLLNALLGSEEYLEIYHELFAEFIEEYFLSGEFEKMYDDAVALIAPYIEKDPTAFYEYSEVLSAQDTLREFCLLRAQSVQGQLDGSIASTESGQSESGNAGFVDASHIDLSSTGSNMVGGMNTRGGGWALTASGDNEPPATIEGGGEQTKTQNSESENTGAVVAAAQGSAPLQGWAQTKGEVPPMGGGEPAGEEQPAQGGTENGEAGTGSNAPTTKQDPPQDSESEGSGGEVTLQPVTGERPNFSGGQGAGEADYTSHAFYFLFSLAVLAAGLIIAVRYKK